MRLGETWYSEDEVIATIREPTVHLETHRAMGDEVAYGGNAATLESRSDPRRSALNHVPRVDVQERTGCAFQFNERR
jgi:hypothetical protein